MKTLIWLYHLLITNVFRLKRLLHRNVQQKCDSRILLCHQVLESEERLFTSQIELISKSWNFVNPNVYAQRQNESNVSHARQLMLTFDDGFESDFRVAQNVLNPRGIKAVFFIIPEFIDSDTDEKQEQFILKHLYPGVRSSRAPTHLRSMNWEQIMILSRQGHTIGSHSTSHQKLSNIDSEAQLINEIVTSGQIIENRLGKKVDHFAFPFGNLSSISLRALQMAADNYKFVYSGLRGSNQALPEKFVRRRETVFPWDPKGFELAVLAGAGDSKFRSSLVVLDDWIQSISINQPI